MGNDITIIGSIVGLFIFIGILLPFVQTEFNSPETLNLDSGQITDQINEEDADSFSAWRIIKSIFLMFFWTFSVPFWLEGFFVVLRIMLVVTIARNLWIGGGS